MKKITEPVSRRQFAAASATLASGALLGVGCGDEADEAIAELGKIVVELVELIADQFSLDDPDGVQGDVVLSNDTGQPKMVEVVVTLKDEEGKEQDSIRTLITVSVDEATTARWSGLKPIHRGQHSVEAHAQGGTVESDPFDVV